MGNIVTDAIGIPASVGDTVVFAPGQRGAQKMLTGNVERITPKGVIIGVDEKCRNECWLPSNHIVRKSECFVIVFKKED